MPPDLLKTIQRRALTGILTVLWIVVPYSLLQHIAIREVLWVKPSTFDLAIPINFHSLWFYLTFYALLGWIGLSVDDRNFQRYIRSIWWTAFFSHLVLLLIPNGVTREAIDHDSAPLVYQWLVLADQPRNAFPSLHASLWILAGMAAIASSKIRPVFKIISWIWVRAWNRPMATPTTRPTSRTGAHSWIVSHRASRPTSITSAPLIEIYSRNTGQKMPGAWLTRG